MALLRKDILDLAALSPAEITHILDTAASMKEISRRAVKKVPTLRGKTVILYFFEPSTRTRVSFDIAAKRLSADSISITASGSSMVKGETLRDTARNLQAMHPDVIVLRHTAAGAAHLLARQLKAAIINAGDGMHAHPTQALLDMLTVREHTGRLAGLTVSIIGDIAHSRVARCNCVGFTKMGARVLVCGPPTMIPKGIEHLGAVVEPNADRAVAQADVIMVLRLQKERQQQYLMSSEREYAAVYGLNRARLAQARPNVVIMHPGPVNRGVEIAPEIADGPGSLILDQVTHGVALRMALLYLVGGGAKHADLD